MCTLYRQRSRFKRHNAFIHLRLVYTHKVNILFVFNAFRCWFYFFNCVHLERAVSAFSIAQMWFDSITLQSFSQTDFNYRVFFSVSLFSIIPHTRLFDCKNQNRQREKKKIWPRCDSIELDRLYPAEYSSVYMIWVRWQSRMWLCLYGEFFSFFSRITIEKKLALYAMLEM